MTTLSIMNELALILRGDHPAWEGDRRANGYAFLRRIVNDMPDDARALAKDIESNRSDLAEETGISPSTILRTAKVLNGSLSDGGPL